MILWVRESKRRSLTKIEPEPEFEFANMAGLDRNESVLNEMFYLPCSTLPSYYNLPFLGANVNLKIGTTLHSDTS